MFMSTHFDVAIIGAGQAGIPLAWSLASAGKSVALIERKQVGGSCINFGCTPTKAAIASARVAQQARKSSNYGIETGAVKVNFEAVLERAEKIAAISRSNRDKELEGSSNPKLLRGHGRMAGLEDGRIELTVTGGSAQEDSDAEQHITATDVVINTGTRTKVPSIPGLELIDYIHAGNWLEHKKLPSHLAIIGGGYIGLEMAQFYRRMGSRVTVMHSASQIMNGEDEDVATALQGILEDEGVDFSLLSRATSISKEGPCISVELLRPSGPAEISASAVFLAVGRRPNTDDLGAENVGLTIGGGGVIDCDDRLATSVDHIWVAGDARGGEMFTHTSWDDFRILNSQLAGDGSRQRRRIVPYAVFTDPELGRVGITEREAARDGLDVRVAAFNMEKSGKATELGETRGLIKVITDSKTESILGAAVLAPHGSELVHIYVALMNAGAPYRTIENAVIAHPTLAESLQSVFSSM